MQKLLGAVMLVAGTSIGVGMLTLPAFLAPSGVYLSVSLILIVWLIMGGAALALAELCWHLPIGTNMLNMSEKTLGVWGKVIMCSTYILLLYSLSSAYFSSLSAITHHIFNFDNSLVTNLGYFIVMWFILKTRFSVLDVINRFLMLVMIASFLVLITGLLHANITTQNLLKFGDLKAGVSNIPLLLTSFGYQIVVPSLHKALGNKSKKPIKKSLFFGSLIPLIFYLLWVLTMEKSLSLTDFSNMVSSGQPVALLPAYLANVLNMPWVQSFCIILVFSAIGTSLLGVSLSILDFYKDSFVRKYAIFLTLIPPFVFVQFFPDGFILALRYSGYFVSVLLVMLPCIMLLTYRNKNNLEPIFMPDMILVFIAIFGFSSLFL